jgi:hypothetical protein
MKFGDQIQFVGRDAQKIYRSHKFLHIKQHIWKQRLPLALSFTVQLMTFNTASNKEYAE